MLDLDCNACGACCAYAADWPAVRTQRDKGPEGPPESMVEDGHVRWTGSRCAALQGEIGVETGCSIYARRTDACRGCVPFSTSCIVARKKQGLAVPEERSSMDELLMPSGSRLRRRRM